MAWKEKRIDIKDLEDQADEWDKKIHALSQSDGTFGWGHEIKEEDTIYSKQEKEIPWSNAKEAPNE